MKWIFALVLLSESWTSLSRDVLHDTTFNNTLLLDPNHDAWFESISELDLIQHWSQDDGTSIQQKIIRLKKLHDAFSIKVDVKLVGFEADGDGEITIDPDQLSKYMDRAIEDLRTYTLGLYAGKQIPFKTSVHFQVDSAPGTLNTKISHEIQNLIDAHPTEYIPPTDIAEDEAQFASTSLTIPVKTIDNIIAQEFEKSSVSHTIYLINPRRPKQNGKDVPYTYIDAEESVCTTAMWLGEEKRYAWIDLGAGPIDFGPEIGGGGFDSMLMPNIKRFAVGATELSAFLTELVDAVYDTTVILVTPSVYTFPVRFTQKIVINLVFVSDRKGLDTAATYRNKWQEVVKSLQSLAIPGQEISIQPHFMTFSECELCVLAYTHSLKSQASKVQLSDDLDVAMQILYDDDVPLQMERYLDSVEMHDWLEHFNQNYAEDMGELENKKSDTRIVTAFIYGLSTSEVVLFDRELHSVPFKDIVISVETETHKAPVLDLKCDDKGVNFNPSDSARATLASLLSTVWGIAPTHLTWNDLSKRKENNFMWNSAMTPYGYLSKSQKISFAVRETAARNLLLSEAFNVLEVLQVTLRHLQDHDLILDEVLHYDDHVMFVRRWNVFHYKLEKALNLMSLSDYERAILYMRSAEHDANSMHEILHESASNLKPIIKCPESVVSTAFWVENKNVIVPCVGILCVFGFVTMWLFKPKSKVKHN